MTHHRTPIDLIRQTCAAVRATLDDDRAIALDRVDSVLALMGAEQTELPKLWERTSQRYGELHNQGKAQSYETALRTTNDSIASGPVLSSPEALAIAVDALSIETAYWRDYSKVVRSQIEKSSFLGQQAGEEHIDIERLRNYLREALNAPDLEIQATSVASRGFSKKTYFVTLRDASHLPPELALRVDQPFNYLGTTVLDEFPVLEHLWQHGVKLPEPMVLEPSGKILGQPFIVFPRIGGSLVGSNFDYPPPNDALLVDIAQQFAKLHKAPIADARPLGSEDVAISLEGLIDKFYADWKATGAASPIVEAAFKWVREHKHLGITGPSYVHSDLNFNNMLIDGNRVEAIVDWEFVYIGSGACDLAYFYYAAESVSSFERFLQAYVEAGGQRFSRDTLDFYTLWGQLKLTIMSFQVVSGFRAGRFDDIRFGLAGIHFLPITQLRVGTKLAELLAEGGLKRASSS